MKEGFGIMTQGDLARLQAEAVERAIKTAKRSGYELSSPKSEEEPKESEPSAPTGEGLLLAAMLTIMEEKGRGGEREKLLLILALLLLL